MIFPILLVIITCEPVVCPPRPLNNGGICGCAVKGGWTWTVCLGNASCFSGLPAHKNVTKYACCPNEYDHVLFTLHIRRRTIYYLVNLIAPCVLLASMTLLEFLLPNECGEKLTLGICSVIRSHFHFSFSNT